MSKFQVGDKMYPIRLADDDAWHVGRALTVGSVNIESEGERLMCHETGVGSGSVYSAEHYFRSSDDAQAECDRRNAILNNGLPKPKIFGFCNGGSRGWYEVLAVTEDGTCLASHCCSHPGFGPGDIGVTTNWKHELYWAHYPNGFVMEWVEDPKSHDGLNAALRIAESKQEAP